MCEKYGKVPIYYRNKQNVHKVAFYVCEYCMNFSGFGNWKTQRFMPYYDEMKSLVKMRLENNESFSFMKRTHYITCFKCDKDECYKLRIRIRDENSYEFVGYVCKNCSTCFFMNTPEFKFGTRDNAVHSIGSFVKSFDEDQEKPEIKEVEIRVKKSDIAKLRKNKIPFTQIKSY